MLPLALAIATALPTAVQVSPATEAVADDAKSLQRLVVTAGRREQAVLDTSTAISVVDQEEIRHNGNALVSDYLRGQAGVFVQQTTPGQGLPLVRGLRGSEVLHLVDGFRLNNAIFRNSPNQYLGLVDASDTQSIEVVRGPASSLYGSDALGGVVQVLTKLPELRGDQDWLEGRILGRYASADNTWLGRGEVYGGSGDVAFRVGVTGSDVGNRRTGNGDTLRPSGYNSHAGDASILWAPGSHEFLFNVQYLEQPNTPRIDELVPGFGQDEASSEVFSFEPNQRVFGHFRYRYTNDLVIADNLELHVGYQSITDDRRSRDTGSVNENRERNESELWGITGQFTKAWNGHILTYGFESYHDQVTSSRIRTNIESGAVSQRTPRFPSGSEIDNFAIYLHDQWQVLDWLRVDVGLRYSNYDISVASTDTTPSNQLDPDDLTGDGALVFSLNESTNLIAGVGRGFRAPNIFDLGTLGERPGNRFNVPSTSLEPETIYTYQLGLRHSGRNFQGEIFGFYSDFDDKITTINTGELNFTGRDVTQSANLTSSELYGIEAAWNWQFSPGWSWNNVINWTRATDTDENGIDEPGDRIPPLNGRSGVVWHASSEWRLEPYVQFAARQDRLSSRDVRDPRINPNGTDGWVTFNLRAAWSPTPDIDVRVRVENIFDNSYREHASGIDAPGVNVIAELDMRFR
jgi:TonB-dependent heme/hemoglobin receptor